MRRLQLKRKAAGNNLLIARRNRIGFVFISPFLIGFAMFVFVPILQSFWFSFNDIRIMQGGYQLISQGWNNYKFILLTDTAFRTQLLDSFQMTLQDTLIVIPFSFLSAIILSKQFKGRTLARAIFFLPVIISTGMLVSVDKNSVMSMVMLRDTAEIASSMEVSKSALEFVNSLFEDSLPAFITRYVASATDGLYSVIIKSGVQIIVFLGGLNTISGSIYESSNIEGATAWVNFWKITFPMCGPYLLLNIVYTIIDSFTNQSNPLIARIWNNLTGLKDFGIASAAAWLYFALIAVVLGIVFYFISRRIYYRE